MTHTARTRIPVGFRGYSTTTLLLLAALAAALPACTTAGGDDRDALVTDTSPDVPTSVDRRTLHFNLGTDPATAFLPHGEDYRLHAGGRSYALAAHDDATRTRFAGLFDGEGDPTHFVDDVELPLDKVLLLLVTQRTDRLGALDNAGPEVEHSVAMASVYVPAAAQQVLAPRTRALAARRSGLIVDPSLVDTYDWSDLAQTLVFLHPGLSNIDPHTTATLFYRYLDDAPGLEDLVNVLQSLGQHQWYTVVPLKDNDGNPVLAQGDHDGDGQPDGTPIVQYDLKPEVKAATGAVVKYVLNAVHNDPDFQDMLWRVSEGTAFVPPPAPVAASAAQARSALTSGYKFGVTTTGYQHGFQTEVTSWTDDDPPELTVSLGNGYVRHTGNWITFYDQDGQPVKNSDFPGAPLIKAPNDHTYWLGVSTPVTTILGVPIRSISDYKTSFPWPLEAQYAKVQSGTFGQEGVDVSLGGLGGGLTLAFDVVIPNFCLGLMIGANDTESFVKKVTTIQPIMQVAIDTIMTFLVNNSPMDSKRVFEKVGAAAGNFVIQIAVNAQFYNLLTRFMTEEAIKKAAETSVPFIGWALNAAEVASAIALVAETTYAVLSSPSIIENEIRPTHDIVLTIDHDPKDYQFPATATSYVVEATFSSTDTRPSNPIVLPGTTVSDPLTYTFKDVPAGGKVKFDVRFYSATGWMAGQADEASRAAVDNVNDAGADHMTKQIVIHENLVPLDEASVYHHKQKLVYENGKHAWKAAAAPTATSASLGLGSVGNVLSALGDVQFLYTGMLGYVWRSHSDGATACAGATQQDHLYTFQNISLKQDPEADLKYSGCGYSEPPYLVYDNRPGEEDLRHFVVVPSNGRFHLRGVSLVAGEPFVDESGSHGSFPFPVDAAVLHPTGRLLAINHGQSKMYSLALAKDPVADDTAPVAVPVGGPATTLDGLARNPALLRHPVSIRLTRENAAMVLDDVHEITKGTDQQAVRARLKVFSITGDPTPYFGGSFSLNLLEPDADVQVTYLDFGVEGQGYLYVLSQVLPTGGTAADATPDDYRLDLFKPDGTFLVRTTGVAAAKIAVDLFRNVYSLNYEVIVGPGGRTEPSVSEWIPPTPVVPK